MVGEWPRGLAILSTALGLGCSARHASNAFPATAGEAPSAAPVYQYISTGIESRGAQQQLAGGRIGVITDGAPGREIVNPDGSLEFAEPGASERLMGGVPVPARLGGGFLFWDHALYLARSFNGPLEPIVELPTNVIGLEFGPDYLLLLAPNAPPRAFTLDPPRRVRLSPKGVIEVAASDDGRALALDATGRAFASTDAGRSWKEVTSALGAPVQGVRAEGTDVAFALPDSRAWLQSNGQFSPCPTSTPAAEVPEPETARALNQAFGYGLPLPGQRALIGTKRGTSVVDLRSGAASPVKELAAEGALCEALSLDEEGLVACISYTPKTVTTVISHALSAKPVIEKSFVETPLLLAGHSLNVFARCSGTPAEGVACVRRSGGVWSELVISTELSQSWQPLFWLPRESGGVVAVVSERDAPEPKLGLLDPATNRVTVWDSSYEQVASNGSSPSWTSSLSLRADGSVHGFTRTGTIEVTPQGHVTPGARTFTAIYNAGPHALARDRDEHLWQTNDYGAHWSEIARPPFDAAPEAATAKSNMRPSGRATQIRCSLSGCALEHSSGTGVWLRAGFPDDPPKSATSLSQDGAATAMGRVVIQRPKMPEPVLPQLHCAARAQAAWRASVTPSTFSEVTWVEPFEPSARQFNVPPNAWAPLDARSGKQGAQAVAHPPAESRFDFDGREKMSCALLGNEPGRAAGALLRRGERSLFVPKSGQSTLVRPGCIAVSGYVDARGKGFVACSESDGSTRLEALEQPQQVIFHAPVAAHYRDRDSPGLRFLAPGEPVFVNPDALAVGRDGKLGILRLPPGNEPPTVDNPAWWLSADGPPIALAPWSTLELSSSAACAGNGGYRAVLALGQSWLDVPGDSRLQRSGMAAIVRWSTDRVCLEAISIGYPSTVERTLVPKQVAERVSQPSTVLSVMARFVGVQPSASLFGQGGPDLMYQSATCQLEAH